MKKIILSFFSLCILFACADTTLRDQLQEKVNNRILSAEAKIKTYQKDVQAGQDRIQELIDIKTEDIGKDTHRKVKKHLKYAESLTSAITKLQSSPDKLEEIKSKNESKIERASVKEQETLLKVYRTELDDLNKSIEEGKKAIHRYIAASTLDFPKPEE